jgi:NAD(P)H-hydrate repair Nnr-like enzyme with NAD(P)H-hydrate dehydratase domain
MARYRGPERAADFVLASHPEAVCEPRNGEPGHAQAWVVGSGMPEDSATVADVEALATACFSTDSRLVIDAGALPALHHVTMPSADDEGARVLITPHAGEMERLLAAEGVHAVRDDIEESPQVWAERAAELTGCAVLLKGPTTWLASPGEESLSVRAGHPWLATAGSGDVLAGVIGALAATSSAPLHELGAVAAWIHGRAGVLAAKQGPYGASALSPALRQTVAHLLAGK